MDFLKALSQSMQNRKAKSNRRQGTRAYYSSGEIYLSRLFGYKKVGNRYEPDPRYMPAIKTIFEMLAAGKTLPEIKAILDDMKVRDSSNNRYSITRIIAIAERPVYAAHLYQRGRLVPVQNLEPIVTLDIWKQAQKKLQIEKRKVF